MSVRNTLANKAIRRNERKARKGDATYNFSDVSAQTSLLTNTHKQMESINKVIKETYGIVRPIFDLQAALRNMEQRIARFTGKSSKYQPHQGKREIARRAAQIKAGKLQAVAA